MSLDDTEKIIPRQSREAQATVGLLMVKIAAL